MREEYFTTPLSYHYLYPNYFADSGNEVTVIALNQTRAGMEKSKRYHLGIKYIFIHPDEQFQRLKFLIKTIMHVMRTKYEILHVFNTYFGLQVIPVIARLRSIISINDIRTCYTIHDKFHVFKNKILKYSSFLYSGTIILDEKVMRYIFEKRIPKKFKIIPLAADINIMHGNYSKNELRKKHSIALKAIVFIYIGSFDSERQLMNIILPFSQVINGEKDVLLILLGDGNDKDKISAYIARERLKSNILLLPRVDYSEIPGFINLADYGVSYIPAVEGYELQPPFKTLEYLLCERPVLGTDTDGNRFYTFGFEHCILVNDSYNNLIQGIKKAIVSCRTHTIKIDNGALRRKYGYKTVINNILNFYYELLGSGNE